MRKTIDDFGHEGAIYRAPEIFSPTRQRQLCTEAVAAIAGADNVGSVDAEAAGSRFVPITSVKVKDEFLCFLISLKDASYRGTVTQRGKVVRVSEKEVLDYVRIPVFAVFQVVK